MSKTVGGHEDSWLDPLSLPIPLRSEDRIDLEHNRGRRHREIITMSAKAEQSLHRGRTP